MQGVGMENKRCILKFKKNFYYWQKKLRAKLIEATAPQLVQLEPVSVLADLLQINFRGAELKLPVGVDMDAVSGILDTTGKQTGRKHFCQICPMYSLRCSAQSWGRPHGWQLVLILLENSCIFWKGCQMPFRFRCPASTQ